MDTQEYGDGDRADASSVLGSSEPAAPAEAPPAKAPPVEESYADEADGAEPEDVGETPVDPSLGGAESPGPGRPAQGATNPKVAGPPPVADQPGLGRAANPVDIPGPQPRLGSDGVGSAIEQARENAAAHREALAQE